MKALDSYITHNGEKMKITRMQLRRLILNEAEEFIDDKDASYKVSSVNKQSDAQSGSSVTSKRVRDVEVDKVDSRKISKILNIEGDIDGLAYSYENLDHLADKNSLPATDVKSLMSDNVGFYDKDDHTEVLHIIKGDTRGTMTITSPYADLDKDVSSDQKARNTKYNYLVVADGSEEVYKDMLEWYAALEKGGIDKGSIQAVNRAIQNKNVPHEKELDKAVKSINESIDRFSFERFLKF
jgi:hypothetical protein